jgi:hypothetical protein
MGRVITGTHDRVTGYVEGVLKLSSDDCLFLGESALLVLLCSRSVHFGLGGRNFDILGKKQMVQFSNTGYEFKISIRDKLLTHL